MWRIGESGREMFGNCYLAVYLYATRGGHLVITRSTGHPIIPHIAWCEVLPLIDVVHFMPKKRRFGWRAIFCSPIFKGIWKHETIGRKGK